MRSLIDNWKIIPFVLKGKKFNFNPVFIIGCGRSGTSILGNTLALHKSICYLHERRDLWSKAYPELDIWSGKYQQPLLYADEKNLDVNKTKKLRKIFFKEQVAGNCKVLLEKLPINSFRLKFLQVCFPEAKYIYLHRNGLEVAKSISKKIPVSWFGYKNLKWNLLLNYGEKNGFHYAGDELAS
ncbi:MAG: sulfotransferase, partial [Parafilimonas sp.]